MVRVHFTPLHFVFAALHLQSAPRAEFGRLQCSSSGAKFHPPTPNAGTPVSAVDPSASSHHPPALFSSVQSIDKTISTALFLVNRKKYTQLQKFHVAFHNAAKTQGQHKANSMRGQQQEGGYTVGQCIQRTVFLLA